MHGLNELDGVARERPGDGEQIIELITGDLLAGDAVDLRLANGQ